MLGRSIRRLLAALLILAFPAAPQALAEKRVALAIGIGDYSRSDSFAPLPHPRPDAESIAAVLREKLGFEVTLSIDPGQKELLDILDAFVRQNAGADVVLIYFAGHGLQVNGRSYVVPSDANLGTATSLESPFVPLEELFRRAAAVAPNGKRIVLVDACRDLIGREASRMRALLDDPHQSVLPGLGRVGTAGGIVYMFATAPGATASDGFGAHSPFAEAVLDHIAAAGVTFNSVMKIMQQDVYDRTAKRQIPYIEDGLPFAVFSLSNAVAAPLSERDRLLLEMAGLGQTLRQQVERIAAAKDVPLAALYVTLLSGMKVPVSEAYEERERRLSQAADDYLELQTRIRMLDSSDPEVTRLRRVALDDLRLGKFDAARAAITQAVEIDSAAADQMEALAKKRALSLAANLDVAAYISRVRLDFGTAAGSLAKAAAIAARWDRQLEWRYTLSRAINLTDQGVEFGDDASLDASLPVYRQALALTSREGQPLDWAETQDSIASVLAAIGWRSNSVDTLLEAATAYTQALKERTRERAPLSWAATQNNLGATLADLGELENSTFYFREAVKAYRAALTAQSRDSDPLRWAKMQGNLGVALSGLGRREARPIPFLQEAAVAFREALSVQTPERSPLDWAVTLGNEGSLLVTLGDATGNVPLADDGLSKMQTAYRSLKSMGYVSKAEFFAQQLFVAESRVDALHRVHNR